MKWVVPPLYYMLVCAVATKVGAWSPYPATLRVAVNTEASKLKILVPSLSLDCTSIASVCF